MLTWYERADVPMQLARWQLRVIEAGQDGDPEVSP